MNDQNQVITPASEEQTLKRKRGRPRRDESISRGSSVVEVQELGGVEVNECSDEYPNVVHEDELLGQVVSGVLSGSFDAGYFVTVKPHNCDTILTGLVFCPGKVVPVTLENDLAPQQKMYIRKEYDVTNISPVIQLDGSTQQPQLEKQTPKSVGQALDNNLGNNSAGKLENTNNASKGYELSHQGFEFGMGNFNTPVEDYRIVDQEEIMKEFEASACMTAPSSASKQTDYNLESLSKLQSDYQGNTMASQNNEAAAVDHCLKLKEHVQVTRNEGSSNVVVNPGCSGLILPSNFCPSEAASLSLKYTPLMGTTTSTQQITDAADQGKSFDVNERPSIDDTTESEFNCLKTSMMLFGSTKPVHSDLKLGFAEELSSSTYEKKNPNKLPAAPFFLNLTDISAETPKIDSSGAKKKPATDNLCITVEDSSQTTRMKTDQTTQETVSSELKLSATVTPQLSNPTGP